MPERSRSALHGIVGAVLVVLGAALTAYSFPFASYVALGAFLLGIAAVVSGVRLIRGRPHHA